MENRNNLKFKNKYRIPSSRLREWDYSRDGAYFVTICTKNRERFFGEILDGRLAATRQMEICLSCWNDLPNHYANCILDAFVIMPDHVHGIIFIDNKPVETIHELSLREPREHELSLREPREHELSLREPREHELSLREPREHELSLREPREHELSLREPREHELSLREPRQKRDNIDEYRKRRRQMTLSKIIGRFKMQTSKKINEYQRTPGKPFWQLRFYDRIIRNEAELNRIREYILNNPLAWRDDQNNF